MIPRLRKLKLDDVRLGSSAKGEGASHHNDAAASLYSMRSLTVANWMKLTKELPFSFVSIVRHFKQAQELLVRRRQQLLRVRLITVDEIKKSRRVIAEIQPDVRVDGDIKLQVGCEDAEKADRR